MCEIFFLSCVIFNFTSLGMQKLSIEYINPKNPNIKNKFVILKHSTNILTSLVNKLCKHMFPNTNSIENIILIYKVNLYCLL